MTEDERQALDQKLGDPDPAPPPPVEPPDELAVELEVDHG